MDDLASWIGRTQTQDDEITRPALRRIAALLDLDDPGFAQGTPIPPHWYAMFFPEIARQSHLGADGHPRRGDFLPPVPLPRRMFAGRRVSFVGALRVGDVATKASEILSVTPKTGRSGAMVFVTIRHTIAVGDDIAVIEEQDVVYREAAAPGAVAPPPPPQAPAAAAWSESVSPTTTLLFRYSAVTWNTHRIHYDADYVRNVENYPDLVMNGGLTALLLIEAAIRRLGRPKGLEIRNVSPLFVNQTVTLAGAAPKDGAASIWAANPDGGLATQVKFIL